MTQRGLIERVAVALHDLGIDDVVFAGGAAVGLLLTDPAAPEPRVTDDVDVVIGSISRTEYQRLEKRLLRSGCTQPTNGPICRWLIAGVPVDLMPVDATTIGFNNRWYAAMMAHPLHGQGEHAPCASSTRRTSSRQDWRPSLIAAPVTSCSAATSATSSH